MTSHYARMSAKKGSTGSSAKKVEPEMFDTRDIVLAKVRGFPAWPGMVVDPTTIPTAVAETRPATKKGVVYVVRFFPTGDYAWLARKDISHLKTAQINAFITEQHAGVRQAGKLMEGYKTALDPVAWEEEQAANPPTTKKRKIAAKKKGEDDEEDEEDESPTDEKEKPGKKRKRASSPAPAKSKAAKAKKGAKGKKSKAVVESEDDAREEGEGGDGGEARASKKAKIVDGFAEPLKSDPEALKVREWRHKLQKTFLRNALPKEEEMPAVDSLLATVEGYQNMNIEYLMFSKIGKVMRHITLLEPGKVPRDEEFKFRERAKALVDKWRNILNANKVTNGESAVVTESLARMDVNVMGEGEGEGDLTVMDVTMNGDDA
ncbi:hypothetical protein DFH06DRAFT_1303285 [Mycena polygramma]|nr:hypothetical protein DFH06DRAFT_1303285 [Mycena polygramma]